MSDETGIEDNSSLLELAQLLALMSRLIRRMSALPQLQEANLGFAEWMALSLLHERDGISNKDLAKRMGVSGQRANQIRTSLEAINLIAVSQSTEDSRKNVIRLTELGRERLSLVNSRLRPLIEEANTSRPRWLVSAIKSVRSVTRILQLRDVTPKETLNK